MALGHLRLGLVLAACCSGVFALSHFLANLIIFWGSSLRGGAHGDVQPVRGNQRRLFWTHLRHQCSLHFYLTYDDVFSTIPRNVGNAKDVALENPSPEHHESFRVRCWTPRKKLLTANLPIEDLLRADVSRSAASEEATHAENERLRAWRAAAATAPIYELVNTRARRQTLAGEEQTSSIRKKGS